MSSPNRDYCRMFKEGDLVFARCTKEKPWPAKITKALKDNMFKVDFYNHNSIGIINQVGLEHINQKTVEFYTQQYSRKKIKDSIQILQAIRHANVEYLRRQEIRKIQSSKWINRTPTKDQLQKLQQKLKMEYKRPVFKPSKANIMLKNKPIRALTVKLQSKNQSKKSKNQGWKDNIQTLDNFIKTRSRIQQKNDDSQNETKLRALRSNSKYQEQQRQDLKIKSAKKQKRIKKKLKTPKIFKENKVKRQNATKRQIASKNATLEAKDLQQLEAQISFCQKIQQNHAYENGNQNMQQISLQKNNGINPANFSVQAQQVKAIDYVHPLNFQQSVQPRVEFSLGSPNHQKPYIKWPDEQQSSRLKTPHFCDIHGYRNIQINRRNEDKNFEDRQIDEQVIKKTQKVSQSSDKSQTDQLSQTFQNLTPSYPNPLFILINNKCSTENNPIITNDSHKQTFQPKQALYQCNQILQSKSITNQQTAMKQQEVSQANSSFMLSKISLIEAQEKEAITNNLQKHLLLIQGRQCQHLQKLYGDPSIDNNDYVSMVQGLPQLKKKLITTDTKLIAACLVEYLKILAQFIAPQNEQRDIKNLQMWQRQLFLGILDSDVLNLKTLIQYQIMFKMMAFLSAFQKNRTPKRALCHVEYLFVNTRLGVYLYQFTKNKKEASVRSPSSYEKLIEEFNSRSIY